MFLFDLFLILVWLIALLIIFRLFYKSGNLHLNSNKILLGILGVFTFGIIRHISMDIIQKIYEINFPIGLIFSTSIVCFIPILCYLYVKKTISNNNSFDSSDAIHFCVFIIFYILFELPFKPDTSQFIELSQDDIFWSGYYKAKKIPVWLLILRNLLNIVYTILTYRLLLNTFKTRSSSNEDGVIKRFLNKFTHIKSNSKQIEHVRIWLYNFTHIKTIMSLMTLYFTLKLILTDQLIYNDQHLATSFISIIFCGLLYFLNKNRTILYNLPSFMNEDSLKRERIKEEIKVVEIFKYIVSQIEENELYLNDQFKLNWLADELEIKAEYISITLLENNFDNFKMFSNYLKIKRAKQLLKNDYLKRFNIEALALDSGFKATNTFYRIFKKETGLTPRKFADSYRINY